MRRISNVEWREQSVGRRFEETGAFLKSSFLFLRVCALLSGTSCHVALVYLHNHVRIHRKRGEIPNTKPTNKPSNLTAFSFPCLFLTAVESSRELKRAAARVPAREQVCKLCLARDPFSSACRPGGDFGIGRECCFWLLSSRAGCAELVGSQVNGVMLQQCCS